jgi:cyanamide hydratase
MVPEPAHVHGWTAVPRSIDAILANMDKANTRPFKVSDIALPQSETALKTMAYAKEHLPLPTFHHSMRVFYYGRLSPSPAPSLAAPGLLL